MSVSDAATVRPDLGRMHARRQELSARFLRGQGVEIGALHQPLWVPSRAKVIYVDRMDVSALRQHYPELASLPLTRVDRIDDGERLGTFADGSLDFVIANHMLEHCENPIGAVRNHLSKLKPGGVLYYAVPDKRWTFDVRRPLTEWSHLEADDRDGPAASRLGHFREYVELVENATPGEACEQRVRQLMEMNYSIHFHVWDAASFADFIERLRRKLGFAVEVLEENQIEVLAVLRKAESLARRLWRRCRLG